MTSQQTDSHHAGGMVRDHSSWSTPETKQETHDCTAAAKRHSNTSGVNATISVAHSAPEKATQKAQVSVAEGNQKDKQPSLLINKVFNAFYV